MAVGHQTRRDDTHATRHDAGPAHLGTPSPPDEWEELRGLLIGRELELLEQLHRRVSDPEHRSADLSEVLPTVVRAAAGTDGRLASALEAPVGQSLRRSIEHDPQHLADALFPVMGPAIRRSIAETLKGFVQSINQAVEHSISPRGLAWRIEAWRGGTTFAEVVLKNTLIYRVDAAYLIHNASGLLIDHAVAVTQTTLKDEDAVSAMLTAIQDFVQDSFSQAGDALETVEIGGRTLWILRGAEATLACLISGLPPQGLREQLERIQLEIHASFGRALAGFDGDKSRLAAVHPLLNDCLALEYRSDVTAARKVTWWPWLVLALVAAAGLGWLWWQGHTRAERLERVRQRLDSTPGIVLLDWETGRRIRAQVLADPLAEDPMALVTDPEVAARLDIDRRPYLSVDPPIVLQRARRLLAPPQGVALALDGGVLRVAGAADPEWIRGVEANLALPVGVDALDLSALSPDHSGLLGRVRAAIEPPEGVVLALDGADLSLSGQAPMAWISDLPARLATVEGLGACDDSALAIAELVQAQTLIDSLQGIEIRFGEAANPLAASTGAIDRAAELLLGLIELDRALDLSLAVTVLGHSDGIGDQPWNRWLRQQRADYVARSLVERGVPADSLHAQPVAGFEPSAVTRPAERWVRIRAEIREPEKPSCATR